MLWFLKAFHVDSFVFQIMCNDFLPELVILKTPWDILILKIVDMYRIVPTLRGQGKNSGGDLPIPTRYKFYYWFLSRYL